MKNAIKFLLQKLLGFKNYLFVFGVFTVRRLHNNHHEQEFLYFLNKVPQDGVVLDIGANIGVMTTALAQKASRGKAHRSSSACQ